MNRVRFFPSPSVADSLRELADAIDAGEVEAGAALVVTGELGELMRVHVLGGAGTMDGLALTSIAQHILLNTVMPDGNLTC